MTQDIHQNEFEKDCFQHNMVYGDCKDLNQRTAGDKVSCGKNI